MNVNKVCKQIDGIIESIEKARRYVKTPEEAPEGVTVASGPRGGWSYETHPKEGKEIEQIEIEQHPRSKYYHIAGIGWAINYPSAGRAHEEAKKYGWKVYKYKGWPGYFVQ